MSLPLSPPLSITTSLMEGLRVGHTVQLDLSSQPGIEPEPLAVEAQRTSHWTTREFPSHHLFYSDPFERLLLNHANTPGFLAPGGEEFSPGPETRLDRSELLCNKILLKYKGDRESF